MYRRLWLLNTLKFRQVNWYTLRNSRIVSNAWSEFFFERRKKKLNLVYALNGIQSRFIFLRFSWSFNLTCFPPFSTWYENGRNWLSLADWDFFIARVSAVSWGSKLIFLILSILLLIQVLCMWKGSRSFNEIKCCHFGLYEFFIKWGFPPFLVAQITNLSSAKWPTNNVSLC